MLSNDTGSLKSLAQEAQQAELSRLETVHFGCVIRERTLYFFKSTLHVTIL